jgi:CTP synthase (UTP-ammonia lyase)
MVGKYTNLSDAYLSVIKSLQHACLAANRKLDILWVEASHLEPQTEKDDTDAYKVNSPALVPHKALTFQSCPHLNPKPVEAQNFSLFGHT